MSHDTQQQLATLLSQAGAAHGAYEERELNGVYDQNWHDWYAVYLVEHGLGDLLSASATADQVSRLLRQCDEDYKHERPGEGWPDYYARRLKAHFG